MALALRRTSIAVIKHCTLLPFVTYAGRHCIPDITQKGSHHNQEPPQKHAPNPPIHDIMVAVNTTIIRVTHSPKLISLDGSWLNPEDF
jgi:hypothetical protein